MINTIIIGDVVRVISGPARTRSGTVRRTTRQAKGYRRAIFWVEVAPGEEHAFFHEELELTGFHQAPVAAVEVKGVAKSNPAGGQDDCG